MRTLLAAIILSIAVAGVPTAAANEPDPPANNIALMSLCNSGLCLARAVGDFNGDGLSDVLIEDGQHFNRRGKLGRALHVYLSVPTTTPGGPIRLAKATTILVSSPAPSRVPVHVSDINGDGRDDIAITGSDIVAGNPHLQEVVRVAVLFGRTAWAPSYDLGNAARGDAVIVKRQRAAARPGAGNALELARATAFFADLTGNGHSDLILGLDDPGRRFDSWVGVMTGRDPWGGPRAFRADMTVDNIGRCERSVGGAADVTGDGIADLVLRQCPGAGLPDRPGLVAGAAEIIAAQPIGELPASVSLPQLTDVPHPTPASGVPTPTRPRGYVPGEPSAFGVGSPPPLLAVTDITGDGVADVVMEFSGRAHVWHGGADVGERLAANISSGIFLNTGFGFTSLSESWRLAQLGSNQLGMVVAHRMPPETPTGRHHVGTPPARAPLGDLVVQRGWPQVVFDASVPPRVALPEPALTLWGIGDFNGDGIDDLLVGHSVMSNRFGIVAGPLDDS